MTISSDVFEKLQSQDWADLLPRLAFYARREIRRRGWSTRHFPPEDFASTAIHRVFIGKRKWDPAKDPDLLLYLCSVIDSLIGHLPSQKKWILSLRDMQNPTNIELAELGHDEDAHHDPEAAVLQAELEAESETAFWELYESMPEDPRVQEILDCIHEGMSKREAIVKKLGIAPSEFDNARRRLKDRLRKTHPQPAAGQAKRR